MWGHQSTNGCYNCVLVTGHTTLGIKWGCWEHLQVHTMTTHLCTFLNTRIHEKLFTEQVGLLGTPTVHNMTSHLCTFLNTRIHAQMTCPNRDVGSSRASRALALPLLGLGTKIITNYLQSKACSTLSSLGNGAKPSAKPSRVQNRSNTITL